MRAVIQRVENASVKINDQITSSIKTGALILIGIEIADNDEDVTWLTKKISQLRIFNDEEGVMNLSLLDINGEALVVSQFTLHARTKKGNRPSYINAAHPDKAIPLYNLFISEMDKLLTRKVQTGEFGAMMDISLTNSGPVTIIIDTKMKE